VSGTVERDATKRSTSSGRAKAIGMPATIKSANRQPIGEPEERGGVAGARPISRDGRPPILGVGGSAKLRKHALHKTASSES
jgi:hypothetical protein